MANDHAQVPTLKTIYLIRHGETEFNRQGVVQGSGVDSDLNDLGKAQAEAFFQHYHHVLFDKVYTSALKVREGKIPNSRDDEYYKVLIDSWLEGKTDMPSEGGESPQDVIARQKPTIDLILSRPEEKTILIAMHGRAIRILLTMLMERPLHEMDTFEHANLCLYKLIYDYQTSKFILELACDVSHLKGIVL
ncbi:MAG: histidine phosphatase family protein [Arcicella sp.]|nr:histidine phosphatase family protein [Arcicella sp.]